MCDPSLLLAGEAAAPGQGGFQSDTKVLKWPGGKRAVFLLESDDSAPAAIKNAIPALPGAEQVSTGRASRE